MKSTGWILLSSSLLLNACGGENSSGTATPLDPGPSYGKPGPFSGNASTPGPFSVVQNADPKVPVSGTQQTPGPFTARTSAGPFGASSVGSTTTAACASVCDGVKDICGEDSTECVQLCGDRFTRVVQSCQAAGDVSACLSDRVTNCKFGGKDVKTCAKAFDKWVECLTSDSSSKDDSTPANGPTPN